MSDRYLPHVASRIFNTPLLIVPRKLDAIIYGLGPRIGVKANEKSEPEMVARKERTALREQGIAIVGIYDTLMNEASGATPMSGGTTYQQIRAQFNAAMNDPAIGTILLHVDSYGGEAAAVFDLAREIRSGRKKKRILASLEDSAYSAAYALASAAERVFIPNSGGAGSVGVVMYHADQSKWDEALGIQWTPIYAGARKVDFTPHAPLSEEAMAVGNAEVNQLYDLFAGLVSKNMNIPKDQVKATEAGLFMGKKAVEVGFAHEIASFTEVLTDLRKKGAWKTMDMATMKTQHAELYLAIKTEGAEEQKKLMRADFEQEKANIETDHAIRLTEAEQKGKATGQTEERARCTELLEADADRDATLMAIKNGTSTADAFKAFYQVEKDGKVKRLSDIKGSVPPPVAPEGKSAEKLGDNNAPDFMASAMKYAEQNKVTLAAAVKAVQKERPELHAQWLKSRKGA